MKKRLVGAMLAAMTGMAAADDGNAWNVFAAADAEGAFIASTEGVYNNLYALQVSYHPAITCEPFIQLVLYGDGSTEGFRGEKVQYFMRVDERRVWPMNTVVDVMIFEDGKKSKVFFNTKAENGMIKDIVEGKELRVKFGDGYGKFDLAGSKAANVEAFRGCREAQYAAGKREDAKYFDGTIADKAKVKF